MRYGIVIVLAILLGFGVWYVRYYNAPHFPSPATAPVSSTNQDTTSSSTVTVVAQNLDTPWAIAFLPGGDMLVTERPGRVRLIHDGKLVEQPVFASNSITELGEGGLLGIAVDPNFIQSHFVYLYYTYRVSGTTVYNKIVQMTYENASLSNEKVLVDEIPSSSNHDGGRLRFGPDGYLYATTGDAETPSQAQDKNTLNGKVLRMTKDGSPAPGNPFSNLVYSLGHRNPQGLAWDDQGNLWETEHGRSGVSTGYDELNLIQSGNNYGWPTIQGDETKTGMQKPISNSGATTTWAPSGLAYLNGALYFGGLKGQSLYRVTVKGNTLSTLTPYLQGQFGRIRDVMVGPDSMLYITTSNQDGRGSPSPTDDKILKVNPQLL